MRVEEIIGTSVGEITAPAARGDLDPYVFQIGAAHFRNGAKPFVAAGGSGLTGAAAVNVWILTLGTWVKLYDGQGNEIQLTATNPQEALLSEGVYGFTKTSDTNIVVGVSMP